MGAAGARAIPIDAKPGLAVSLDTRDGPSFQFHCRLCRMLCYHKLVQIQHLLFICDNCFGAVTRNARQARTPLLSYVTCFYDPFEYPFGSSLAMKICECRKYVYLYKDAVLPDFTICPFCQVATVEFHAHGRPRAEPLLRLDVRGL